MKIAKHLQTIKPSYIREILKAATTPGMISLAGGLPAEDQFPYALLDQAFNKLTGTSGIFQYGSTEGYGPLLEYVRSAYQLSSQQRVLVCNGSQQAIDLIARSFINPGDTVAMEAPSYLGALQVFGLAQANIKTVKQLADGPDLEALELLFRTGKVKLFYTVPDFHNPTGICWSLSTRKKVASLCQQYRVALIEDAPYRALRFDGETLPMVSSFCPEQSFILHSFSKIATPGIRLGIVIAPTKWLEPLIVIKQASDLHTNQPLQAVLLDLLMSSGFRQHLDNVCGHYRERFYCLAKSLRQHFGNKDNFSFTEVKGGMFTWLRLPHVSPISVAKEALKKGIAVVPGNVFYTDHESSNAIAPALRLNFSHTQPAQIETAIALLKSAVEDILEHQNLQK